MILIAGTISFSSRRVRDEAVAACVDMQQSTRDTEPGCLAYSFAADSGVDHLVQVYELWEDEASLAAHFEHPNFAGMKQLLSQFERIGASGVQKFRCDLAEPVYDSERRPRADFFTTP